MAEGRAAALDTSWGLSSAPTQRFSAPPMRDAAHGVDLVFGQNRVKSETRVVEQGEEN